MPRPPGEEPPAEELTRFRTELAQVPASDVQAHHPRRLLHHEVDAHAVACRAEERVEEPEPEDEGERRRVEQAPPDLEHRVTGQVRAGELVGEGEPDGEVGAEVQRVPGLVAESPPGGPRGEQPDRAEQRGRDRRREKPGEPEHLRRRGHRIDGPRLHPADRRRRGVQQDQDEDRATAARMPASQPIRAHASFERRDPRHQQQHRCDAVPGPHPAEMRDRRDDRRRERRTDERHRPGHDRSDAQDAERRAVGEAGAPGPRHGARRSEPAHRRCRSKPVIRKRSPPPAPPPPPPSPRRAGWGAAAAPPPAAPASASGAARVEGAVVGAAATAAGCTGEVAGPVTPM